jgi:hypothetical protein
VLPGCEVHYERLVWALQKARGLSEAQCESRELVGRAAGEALDDWAMWVLKK